jgi:high-affinity iron transporter
MLPSYILSLREGLEAALIIGIVLGALHQMRRRDLASSIWSGALSAALLSLLAAILLTNMSRRACTLKSTLESNVQHASQGGKRALFGLAFLAVLREGVELALFLTAATLASDARQTIFGSLLGLGTAILLGWSLFATTTRLDLRRFFQVTGVLLIFFTAGLVAHGVHEFNEVGWIPSVIQHVWNINPFLDEKSTLGQMLAALFGYNGDPTLTEIAAYLAYFAAILFGLRRPAQNETAPQAQG